MRKKLIIALLNCTLILLASSFCVFAQENEIDLKDKRITIKVEKKSVRLIFRYLMSNYDIPIGFEESILDRDHSDYSFTTNPGESKLLLDDDGSIKINTKVEEFFKPKLHPITLNFENERLEDVLNKIVKQMKNYKWEINDGVVNIFPIKGRDERFENLLGIPINRFTLEEGQTIEDITTNIQSSHEIFKFLNANNLVFTGVRNGAEFVLKTQYGRRIDEKMDFSNLTLRELLNKITKIKKGGWVLKWKWVSKPTGKEHIDIDI